MVATPQVSPASFGDSCSISGDWAVVGAPRDTNGGAVYLFRKVDGAWVQVKRIRGSDTVDGDQFGRSVAIASDHILVGVGLEDEDAQGTNTLADAGAAYVFARNLGGVDHWGQRIKLVSPDRQAGDRFGRSVAIDGDIAVIGANLEDEDANGSNTLGAAGSAYIFARDQEGPDAWGLVRKIVASDRAGADVFGASVAISRDHIIVGAVNQDLDASGSNFLSQAGAAYVFGRDVGGTNGWGEIRKIVPTDRKAGDRFGLSVAITGERVIVGAPDQDFAGPPLQDRAGAAYLFARHLGGTDAWGEEAKLVHPERTADDRFGNAVAIDGDFAVVGVRWDDGEGTLSGSDMGAAMVFARDEGGPGNWGWFQTLQASDRQPYDNLGGSVAIDEGQVFAGAPLEDGDGLNAAGAVYVYQICRYVPSLEVQVIDANTCPDDRVSSIEILAADDPDAPAELWGDFEYSIDGGQHWTNEAIFTQVGSGTHIARARYANSLCSSTGVTVCLSWTAPTALIPSQKVFPDQYTSNVNFGGSVAVSEDWAMQGVPGDLNGGAVYLYRKATDGSWSFVKRMRGSDTVSGDRFGWVVSISGDRALVGARYHRLDAQGGNPLSAPGAAYVFAKDQGGPGNWGQVAKLVARDRDHGAQFATWGALSGDTAIIGAPFESKDAQGANPLQYAGAAYVYSRNVGGPDAWGQVAKLVAPDREAYDSFGYALAIAGDRAVIGSPFHELDAGGTNRMNNAGAAYVFERDQGGHQVWGLTRKIVPSDRANGDLFGFALGTCGELIVAGAYEEDEDAGGANTLTSAGSAYIFSRDRGGPDAWGEVTKITAPDRGAGDQFGISVAMSVDRVLIGARFQDEDTQGQNTLTNAGAAYLFERHAGGLDAWGEVARLNAFDRRANSRFSEWLAMAGDEIIVSAPWEEMVHTNQSNTTTNTGASYAFRLCVIPTFAVVQTDTNACPTGQIAALEFQFPSACSGATYETSIDGGVSWSTAPQYSGLADGTYLLQVRQAEATHCVSAITTQVLVYADTVPPVIIGAPSNLTVACGSAIPAPPEVIALDDCGQVVLSPQTNAGPVTCAGSGIVRVWRYTDPGGHEVAATQELRFVDVTPPVLAGVPSNAFIACDAAPPVVPMVTATDDCGNAVLMFRESVVTGNCAGATVVRQWAATNDCGLLTVATQILTRVDNDPPVFTRCPPAETVSALPAPDPMQAAAADCRDVHITVRVYNVSSDLCEEVVDHVYVATDECGNQAVCTQRFTRPIPPVLSVLCPTGGAVQCREDVPEAGSVVISQECLEAFLTVQTNNSGNGCGGVVDYVFVVSNVFGALATCTQRYSYGDTEPPVITNCPVDVVVTGSPPALASVGAIDHCGLATVSGQVATVRVDACELLLHHRFTATDPCGNASICTQVITVVRTSIPSIVCPTSVIYDCHEQVPGPGAVSVIDPCDPNPILSVVTQSSGGVCTGTVTYVFRAVNRFGNVAVCTQTLTVIDRVAPVIICPADVSLDCDASTNAADTGRAKATDNCGTATVTFADAVTAGAYPGARTIARVWTATDPCGNDSSCTQTLTVADLSAPSFDPPADITVECGDSTDPSATGTPSNLVDNCGTVTASFVDAVASSACAKVVTRTWTVADDGGNSTSRVQTITIEDTIAPDFDVPPDTTVNFGDSTDPAVTGTASNHFDACDLAGSDFIDAFTPYGTQAGIIIRSWRAWDGCGHTNIRDQVIEIVSTNGPFFDLPPDATIECGGGSTNVADLGTISNVVGACHLLGTNLVDQTLSGACGGSSVIHRFWSVFDDCGNTNTRVQVIQLVDTTPPTFDPPPDGLIECDRSGQIDPVDTGSPSNVVDTCGTAVVTFVDAVTPGACAGARTIARVWTATDACGNAASCTQILRVADTTVPLIVCPANLSLECGASTNVADTGLASGTDTCGTAVVTFVDAVTPGACAGARTIARVWTATDACGHAASCTQTLRIIDTTVPLIVCPADLSLECGASTNVADTGLASGTDTCGTAAVTVVDAVTPGACAGARTIARVWTATDACGNAASCTQTLRVIDTTVPLIVCPADLSLECGASTNVADTGLASGTDTCGTAVVTFVDAVTPGACAGARTIARVWTATDACGHAASCTQILRVADTMAPTFDAPPDLSVRFADPRDPSTTGMPSNYIDCADSVGIAFADAFTDGSPGTSTLLRTWQIVDDCGNTDTHVQTITILPNGADLQLTSTASPALATTSAWIQVTLHLTNIGTEALGGIVVTNTLPSRLADVVVLEPDTGCRRIGDDIVCRISDLPPGGATQIVLRLELDSCCTESVTNRAVAVSDKPDVDPTDNRSDLVILVRDNDGDGDPDFSDPDDDNDGIPDTWEDEHRLDPLDSADATLHSDGDGVDNFGEFMADTDPHDEASYLRITDLVAARVVVFPSRATRQYTLQTTEDLLSRNWTNLAPHVQLDGMEGFMAVTNRPPVLTLPLHHYRIVPSVPQPAP